MSNDITIALKWNYRSDAPAYYASKQQAEQVAASIPTVWGDYGSVCAGPGNWAVIRISHTIDLVVPHYLSHGMIWSMTQLAQPVCLEE